jgi:hypothetical protein
MQNPKIKILKQSLRGSLIQTTSSGWNRTPIRRAEPEAAPRQRGARIICEEPKRKACNPAQ